MAVTAKPKPRHEYELLVGLHYERNPDPSFWKDAEGNRHRVHDPGALICYGKNTANGSIVVSDRELDRIFPNKFRKVIHGEQRVVEVTAERRQLVDRLIESGAWQDTDRTLLESLPESFFQRMLERTAPRVPTEGKVVSTLGEDVTHQHSRAYDEGFRVFKNAAGKHQVTRPPNHDKPLNPKPLAAEAVDEFVDRFLKEARSGSHN